MNWPPLSQECTDAIANVLRDAVRTKPTNPLDQVARQLQELSSFDPDEYERFFLECKAKPRTYILEDVCPPHADPFSWVPMRYNDDTILKRLAQSTTELVADTLSTELITNFDDMLQRAAIAFPELAYIKGSPEELLFAQTFRALYLLCTRCPEVMENLDDANAQLSFSCERLVEWGRNQVADIAEGIQMEAQLEALMIGCLLRVVGQNLNFQTRLGGGAAVPEAALLHAFSTAADALPSYARLNEEGKTVVVASLQVQFPIRLLFTTEAVPYHFQRMKDVLASFEGGLPYVLSIMAIEHVAHLRTVTISAEEVDIKRVAVQSLCAVEKRTAVRAYELLLKKRAERQAWRMMRDDLIMRATIRLCCFAGLDGKQSWGEMLMIVDQLPTDEQEVLKGELGRKDGLSETPCFVLHGANAVMNAAADNPKVGHRGAVKCLIRVLRELQLQHKGVHDQIIDVKLGGLVAQCRAYREDGPVEEMPFVIEPAGVQKVSVRTSFGS